MISCVGEILRSGENDRSGDDRGCEKRSDSYKGTGVQSGLGYGQGEVPQALVQADGDGEADIQLAADRDDGVGVEAAVGPAW